MIREITTDLFGLSQKCQDATKDDLAIVNDLVDTLIAHQEECVGLAANMIGFNKNIIVVKTNQNYLAMINPKIIKTSQKTYFAYEGCLCHQGTKETLRYEQIKVAYLDSNFKPKIKTFNSYVAQIIQHEIDHCNGILI